MGDAATPILASDANYQSYLAENPKVVVKFFADWCGNCKLIAPKYRKLAESGTYPEVVFLDVNAESNPEFRKLAGVSNLPFFATFRNGKLVQGDAVSKIEAVEQMVLGLN